MPEHKMQVVGGVRYRPEHAPTSRPQQSQDASAESSEATSAPRRRTSRKKPAEAEAEGTSGD